MDTLVLLANAISDIIEGRVESTDNSRDADQNTKSKAASIVAKPSMRVWVADSDDIDHNTSVFQSHTPVCRVKHGNVGMQTVGGADTPATPSECGTPGHNRTNLFVLANSPLARRITFEEDTTPGDGSPIGTTKLASGRKKNGRGLLKSALLNLARSSRRDIQG